MNCNKHTKMVEVPQERVWKYDSGLWAFVWEDGYDALAYIHADHHRGVFHWWTRGQRSGFSSSMDDAKRDASGALEER